jgi:RimJ/RimL family protein N-acetyltransferase
MHTTLYTPRLILRPFTLADALRVEELVSDARVALTTARIPHPYPEGGAVAWIEENAEFERRNTIISLAITLAGTRTPDRELDPTDTGHLIGSVCLVMRPGKTPDLGYWLGHAWWGKGFMTEAANAVLKYAFTRLDLDEVVASHGVLNPASGRVLQKLGMTHTHDSNEFFPVRGQNVELAHYALTREQWSRRQFVHRWKPARALAAT